MGGGEGVAGFEGEKWWKEKDRPEEETKGNHTTKQTDRQIDREA